jgi:hypothetical protein
MIEMPIDTLYEIFRLLDPLDLLYLSWASKSLRGIVMNKSARYIWEEVVLISAKGLVMMQLTSTTYLGI